MQFLSNIPWIVKILGTLGIILVANRLLRNLSLALAVGSLTLAFLSGHSAATIFSISGQTLSSLSTIGLLIAITQINILNSQMAATDMLQDLVGLIQSRVSPRTSMAVLPVVIGLLPVPGGALFSAPLVDNCDAGKNTDPCLKSVINFWFRHIWEFCWPLFPGILLAMEIGDINLFHVLLYGVPLCLSMVLTGYLFLLRKVPAREAKPVAANGRFLSRFLLLTSPIIIVVGTQSLFQVVFPELSRVYKYLPIILGNIIAALFLQSLRPLKLADWRKILRQKKIYAMTLMIAMIKVYSAFIDAKLPGGTPLVTKLSEELTAFGIPVLFLTILLPFITGLTTGLSLGFVGTSFPLIFSFLGTNPGLGQTLATLALAYGCGLMGVMISPLHVCLLVSNEYFEVKLSTSLRYLLKPAGAGIICALAFYFLFGLIPG